MRTGQFRLRHMTSRAILLGHRTSFLVGTMAGQAFGIVRQQARAPPPHAGRGTSYSGCAGRLRRSTCCSLIGTVEIGCYRCCAVRSWRCLPTCDGIGRRIRMFLPHPSWIDAAWRRLDVARANRGHMLLCLRMTILAKHTGFDLLQVRGTGADPPVAWQPKQEVTSFCDIARPAASSRFLGVPASAPMVNPARWSLCRN